MPIPPIVPVTGTDDEKREKVTKALEVYDDFVANGRARIAQLANGTAGDTQPSADGRSAREETGDIVESFVIKGDSYLRDYAGYIKFSNELKLTSELDEYRGMLKKLRGEP